MRHKSINEIGPEDIRALVDGQVREDRHLDYKEKLPTNSGDDKREFLADVVAFANSGGGDIVYGIGENRDSSGNTGLPVLKGLPKEGIDKERLRLEQMIQTGIAPRVPGVAIKEVDLGADGVYLVLRIPASWAGPHMIWQDRRSHFYARNSAGKYPLDVTEIRTAFNASEGVIQRVREFRLARIAKILGNETPAPFGDKACCVLHVVSFAGQAPGAVPLQLDRSIQRSNNHLLDPWENSQGFATTFNLDGMLTFDMHKAADSHAVLTLFRTGAVESINGYYVSNKQIYPSAVEENVIGAISRHCSLLRAVGAEGPLAISMTWLNVKGVKFVPHQNFMDQDRYVIDRSVLLFPEIVVDDQADSRNLRTLLDLFWQAAGHERSPSYNQKGEYAPP